MHELDPSGLKIYLRELDRQAISQPRMLASERSFGRYADIGRFREAAVSAAKLLGHLRVAYIRRTAVRGRGV